MLNEGFWDALTNKLKTKGLTVLSNLGSKQSEGKLDARLFATAMYKRYKQYLGQINQKANYENLADFLVNEIGLNKNFVIKSLNPNAVISEPNNSENEDLEDYNSPPLPNEKADKTIDNDLERENIQNRNYSILNSLKKQNYDNEQKLEISKELLRLMRAKK